MSGSKLFPAVTYSDATCGVGREKFVISGCPDVPTAAGQSVWLARPPPPFHNPAGIVCTAQRH